MTVVRTMPVPKRSSRVMPSARSTGWSDDSKNAWRDRAWVDTRSAASAINPASSHSTTAARCSVRLTLACVVGLGQAEEHRRATTEAGDVGAEGRDVGDVGEVHEEDVVAGEVLPVALGERGGEPEERLELTGDRGEGQRVGDDPDDVELHLRLVGERKLIDRALDAGARDAVGDARDEGHDLLVERRPADELERHLVADAEMQAAARSRSRA